MNCQNIISFLRKLSNTEIAAHSQKYFKTGKGEYGQGDVFLGIRVPVLRKAIKQFEETPLFEIRKLLKSEYHEARLLALLLLVHQFSKADELKREKIYNLYLENTKYINNWDLVDCSAPYIVGVNLPQVSGLLQSLAYIHAYDYATLIVPTELPFLIFSYLFFLLLSQLS